ncbi:mitochondrial potassium channel ATP-binding subunit [Ischnura elegans]|uniref:mitochondrial potassium channel ATP-binding subunit n=1 Tax=Ischnura elegans TaxID=197161 RepID=UPI001ED8BAB0|nr:mitochondrial potassium channel ATP-binding subunit [Ischnura elegans]
MLLLARFCNRCSSTTQRAQFFNVCSPKSNVWPGIRGQLLRDKIFSVNNGTLRHGSRTLRRQLTLREKLGIGISLGCGFSWWTVRKVVFCEARGGTRVVAVKVVPEKDEVKFDWKGFGRLIRPDAWRLLMAVLAAFVVALLNIEIPRLLGNVVNIVAKFVGNKASNASFTAEVKDSVMVLVNLYIAQSVFTFLYICLLSSIGERVAAQMRKDLFASIVKQDMAFFDTHRTGELVDRLTSDVQEFKSSFKMVISQGLRSATQIAGCGVSLYLISPQMAGGMLVVIPLVIVTGTLIGSVLRKISRQAQIQAARATVVGEEAISNIRTVRAFASEGKEVELYNKEVDDSNRINEILGFGVGLFQGGTNLFLNGLVLATLYVGGYMVSTNSVTPGDLMSFLVATQTIQRSLAQLSLLFGHFVRGMSAGSRVFEYINQQPSMPLVGGKIIPFHSLIGDVSFERVSFTYPTRPKQVVLDDFSLKVPSGRVVAIVGSSGSGKSTVVALLERFYDVNEGSVKIDGIDVRNVDPSWLRGRAIGYIGQEPILFATSIKENIRYGRPNATDEQVIEAAKMANAHEFIESFPNGYDTVVGERGVTVSGGQKQRIAIARALIKNPTIIILDEATSALDAKSEKIVQETLDNVIKGKTVLVIAHRLSTIRDADVIAVLHKGKIVEIGTHHNLVKAGGFYWNLIKQQQSETSDGERTSG